MDNAEYVKGLRELADWIERHPEIKVPSSEIVNYNLNGMEEASALLKALAPCEKRYSNSTFNISRDFGPITYRFMFLRNDVCTPKVVGKKRVSSVFIPERTEDIIEWECHPLLK